LSTGKRPVKRRRSRRTGGKSALLEQCVESLQMVGFQIYQSNARFQRASVVPARYVIRNYPHPSVYGTPGKKEALIVAPNGLGYFALEEDGSAQVILEAKWQEASGSVDEKFPYIWEAFIRSPVRNWVIVLDGRYWRTGRGKAAVGWRRALAPWPEGRRLHVLDRKGFIDLATMAWGNGP
jgi:hypothetical protein